MKHTTGEGWSSGSPRPGEPDSSRDVGTAVTARRSLRKPPRASDSMSAFLRPARPSAGAAVTARRSPARRVAGRPFALPSFRAPPKGSAAPCKAKLDVVIVLDGSASILPSEWPLVLQLTNRIVGWFDVSAQQVGMAVVLINY